MSDKQTIIDLIAGFVDKCGGIEKVQQAVKAMKGVKDRGEITAFVQRLGQRPDGAQQFFAAALMGFSIASMVHQSETDRQTKGN